jgi:hypothetical protein
MRSRRKTFESACRVGAFALLGWMIGTSLMPVAERRLERASATTVASKLASWTRMPAGVALHTESATSPEAWIVDWLAALGHSGHAVTWSGGPPAVAMSVEALPDPNGAMRIDVATPAQTSVVLRDDASVIDSLRVNQLGGTVVTPMLVGSVVGSAAGQIFSARASDTPRLRSIAVVGAASWEGKFIASALEERGWPVIARFHVAPSVDVAEGGVLPLDTSRIAAVVALDTTIESLGVELQRFVRSGGGLVLAGPASRAASVAALSPGSLAPRTRPALRSADTIALGSTGFYPVNAMKPDGVVLDRRADGIAIAARRVGAGRVLQVGYDDSWRWRMAGGVASEREHREWWTRAVGSVAYVPGALHEVRLRSPESAPLAYLVSRLGPAQSAPASAMTRSAVDRRILMALIMILLLSEWASRRLRGAR